MHFAQAMERDRGAAEDLVSDTILAALERFNCLNDPQAFLSYLFTIATRIHRRRRWRNRLFGAYDPKRAELLHDTGTSPEVSADVHALYDAMRRLPKAQREAIALFEISGLSIEEIRVIQGGTVSAVKMRLSRGRERLAGLLGVEGVEKNLTVERRSDVIGQDIYYSFTYPEMNNNG
jgi:RNA polymerase sigma-70 factor (ECF subfamily)